MSGARSANSLTDYRKVIAFCLLALLLSFATLVPGGPIENRDFSHMTGLAFWGFNTFLIALAVAGFVSVFSVWKGKRAAYWAAIIIGWLYVAVAASDLGRVFPVSPDPTGFALGIVMIADAILGLNVVLFSHMALGHI